MNRETFGWKLKRLAASVQEAIDTGLAALAARVGLLEEWWSYLGWRYGVQTVIADGDGETYSKQFTETINNGGSQVA